MVEFGVGDRASRCPNGLSIHANHEADQCLGVGERLQPRVSEGQRRHGPGRFPGHFLAGVFSSPAGAPDRAGVCAAVCLFPGAQANRARARAEAVAAVRARRRAGAARLADGGERTGGHAARQPVPADGTPGSGNSDLRCHVVGRARAAHAAALGKTGDRPPRLPDAHRCCGRVSTPPHDARRPADVRRNPCKEPPSASPLPDTQSWGKPGTDPRAFPTLTGVAGACQPLHTTPAGPARRSAKPLRRARRRCSPIRAEGVSGLVEQTGSGATCVRLACTRCVDEASAFTDASPRDFASTIAVSPRPTTRKTRTIVAPTSASPTWRTTPASNGRATPPHQAGGRRRARDGDRHQLTLRRRDPGHRAAGQRPDGRRVLRGGNSAAHRGESTEAGDGDEHGEPARGMRSRHPPLLAPGAPGRTRPVPGGGPRESGTGRTGRPRCRRACLQRRWGQPQEVHDDRSPRPRPGTGSTCRHCTFRIAMQPSGRRERMPPSPCARLAPSPRSSRSQPPPLGRSGSAPRQASPTPRGGTRCCSRPWSGSRSSASRRGPGDRDPQVTRSGDRRQRRSPARADLRATWQPPMRSR